MTYQTAGSGRGYVPASAGTHATPAGFDLAGQSVPKVDENTPGWRMVLEEYLLEHDISKARDLRPFVQTLSKEEIILLNKGLRGQRQIVMSQDELAVMQMLTEAVDEEWDLRFNSGVIPREKIIRRSDYNNQIVVSCRCGWKYTITAEQAAKTQRIEELIDQAFEQHSHYSRGGIPLEYPPF